MKILYLGTVCDITEYERLLANCKAKPSVASIVFESSLLTGLKFCGADVEVYSYPMIPAFPTFRSLGWGSKTENLPCGYKCTWLKTINVPVIKQLSRRLDGRRIIKKWLKANKGEDCVVLSYSIPPFLAKDIIKLAKKYGAKSIAIVTDLLRDMYINSQSKGMVKWAKNRYLSKAIALQGNFDAYVYLTEAMKDVVNLHAPYMIMEGIADVSTVTDTEVQKENAIMYAGALEEKFGIINLIKAYKNSALKDTKLWIFGSGNATEQIEKHASLNKNICFFGRKSRDEILRYEKKALLLVNPRSTRDEFTKYSFPSKTIEYMMSGTAMLTTKLAGIPKEYHSHLFLCEDNNVPELQKALEHALSFSEAELSAMGEKAKQFITEEKNANKQSARLIDFMERVCSIDKS